MSRLTNKVDGKYYPIMNQYGYDNVRNEIYHKLGKLEDLEDELGCSLDVVFKALKDKEIIVKYTYGLDEPIEKLKTHKISGLSIYFTDFVFWVYDDIIVDNEFDVNLKDYKKTWWLKEELKENEQH